MTPTLADKVRIVQKYGTKTPRTKSTIFATRPRLRESTRSFKRSAYAFSHQEGFAALIREGKMMPEPNVIKKKNFKNFIFKIKNNFIYRYKSISL